MKRLLCALALTAAACQNAQPEEPLSPGSAATLTEPGGAIAAQPGQRAQDPRGPLSLGSAATLTEPAGELDVDVRLAQAREQLAAGQPHDALASLDELHVAGLGDDRTWYLFGKAAFAAAEQGQGAGNLYQDAQAAFEKSASLGGGADALLGASRAARMNLDPDHALDLARQAAEAAAAVEPAPQLEQSLERTLSEALFGSYVARVQADENASELFAETEENLRKLTESQPTDPWAWSQLANLYQWGEEKELAADAAEKAMLLALGDQAAHARYIELQRAAAGMPEVVARYEALASERPDDALIAWYLGVERFNLAVGELHSDRESIPLFERAEAELRRCRELEPGYEASCKGYEVMCRSGVAWTYYGKGEMDKAEAAFLSMEEHLPGGLDWEIQGSLRSGLTGLQLVADKFVQRGKSEFDLEGKREAAAIFDRLRELRPDNPDFANNAGFFHRDACVVLELEAERKLRSAEGRKRVRKNPDAPIEEAEFETVQVEVAPAEAQELRAEADQKRAEAMEQAELSYRAYQQAARLAPDDVRVTNDAALVMVYHIRKDVPEMEGLLERAIELGARQVQDPELSPEDLDSLLEAWGDAHQNMGLVYLTLKNDPATARTWFEKAFEIGPRPRVDRAWVEQVALPACDKAAAGDPAALADLDPRLWLHVGP